MAPHKPHIHDQLYIPLTIKLIGVDIDLEKILKVTGGEKK